MRNQRSQSLNAPLRQSIEYCGRCKGAHVFVWDGSKNPFGTFKDMRNRALIESDQDRKELIYVQVSYGNSGYSLGMMAKQMESESESGIKRTVVNIVPKGKISPHVRRSLGTCSIVHEMDLGKEIVQAEVQRRIARSEAGYEGPEDAIVHVESYGLENGYRRIIHEIADKGIKPAYVFCPVGEGELATELASEAESLWGSDAPKVIGVTIPQNAILKKDDFIKKPGASIADKLVNGYSKFKPLVLNLIERGRMELIVASEREIAREYGYLASVGIAAEPSAAAAFAGAVKYDLKPDDVVVIINTGKGIYDQKSVDKIWIRRLMRAGKHVAVLCAGMLLAFGVMKYHDHVERRKAALEAQNSFLELQKKELAQMNEYNSLGALLAHSKGLLDKNGDNKLSKSELEELVRIVPGAELHLSDYYRNMSREHPGSLDFGNLLGGYTESQLGLFIKYKELSVFEGNLERMIKSDLRREYEAKLARGEMKERSVDERLQEIWDYRNVDVPMVGISRSCRFRPFDMNNPFDPNKEKTCWQ